MEHLNPISDEMIAAYLDGNATSEDTQAILSAMQSDAELRDVLSVATQSDGTSAISLYPMQCMAAENPKNLCAFYSELYVLRKRGINVDEQYLLQFAQNNHWVTKQGTPLYAIGNLLTSQGFSVTQQYNASTEDVISALKANNDVIVAVDIEKLYPNRPDPEDAPNHAMVVVGIDEETDSVTMYEPEVNTIMDYHLSNFLSAWNESNNYLVLGQRQ